MKKHSHAIWASCIKAALQEDLGSGDSTTQCLVPPTKCVLARLVAREQLVVCGLEVARLSFQALDRTLTFTPKSQEGQMVQAGACLAHIKGKAQAVLSAERVALNFLGRLSGIATLTRQFVVAIKDSRAVILDTRKTTPGLRDLERYAVKTGGGTNHRLNLSAMLLVKDNHRAMLDRGMSLANMMLNLRRKTAQTIEVEVDTLAQLADLLDCPPDIVLLDNMSLAQLRLAVRKVALLPKEARPLVEASGGITLRNVRQVALTGVDRISVGALTHSVRCADVSLEFEHY